ncbi:DUF7845 domain-containing protein [Halogeometricum rufum]|uniref:DUF7845 domain-containing protein n=1 Tax=Halogeometricum rufum TaxID=553469 RepID=UPI000B7D47CF|nr:AsnC family protein [Halogeometricum rufum]
MSEDVDDPLDFLGGAEPVTSDDQDSVTNEVENTEANRIRSSAGTDGADLDASDDESEHEEPASKFVAECRWCRVGFESEEDAGSHEDCSKEPVSACRFCGEEHTSRDDPEDHLYSCDEYQRYREKEVRNSRARTMHSGGGLDTRQFIDGQPHEFSAYLKYDNALSTYFGLVSLYKMHDFEEYGRLRAGLEFDDQDWNISFGFKNCGIKAPEDDSDLGPWDWRLEDPIEFLIYVYPSAYESYAAAGQENRQRAFFNVSPRWPNIESVNDNPISNPHDLLGVDVDVKGSYFEFDQYADLFHDALNVLRERQTEFGWNSYTSIDADACHPEQTHESSNVTDAEYYVRVAKELTGKVYAFDGTLHRISLLLGRERAGYSKTVRDDRECPGHYHTATIGAMRAAALVGGHELPKEFKHYHMRKPDANAGTALENPKLGVSFQHGLYDDTMYWDDLDRLERELDEGLLNLLRWSDLPTTPDHQVFVADDYFSVTGSRRFRKIIENPLPRIAQQQDEEVRRFAVAGNLTETDVDLVDQLLTDGGHHSPADLAERIGVHISTCYKSLKRLGSIVQHDYGSVELASKHIAQGVVEHIDSARAVVENTLEEAADDLVRAETFGDDDPWSRWLDHYVDDVHEHDGSGNRDVLEFGWKPSDRHDAKRLIRAGAMKWAQVAGEDMPRFAREFEIEMTLADNSRFNLDWRALKKLLPRNYSVTPSYG